LALPLFGLHVPYTTLLAYLPLIFFFAALPIAAAHLGPAQAAWVIFLGHAAAPDKLVAFSLAAHLTFMLMNAAIGVLFLRRAVRRDDRQRDRRGEAPGPRRRRRPREHECDVGDVVEDRAVPGRRAAAGDGTVEEVGRGGDGEEHERQSAPMRIGEGVEQGVR